MLRFLLGFSQKVVSSKVCITVCDQGESSRTGSKHKLVAIVDGLAAGSPYSQSVYPPTSWPYFWKFVISDLPTRTPKMLLGPRACEGLLLSCTWALHARFHSPTGGGGGAEWPCQAPKAGRGGSRGGGGCARTAHSVHLSFICGCEWGLGTPSPAEGASCEASGAGGLTVDGCELEAQLNKSQTSLGYRSPYVPRASCTEPHACRGA